MADAPLILAFDTSGPHCAVAVLRGDAVLASTLEAMSKGQAERLMPLIEETLASAGVALSALDGIGVGIGPGNFTGIRISVSAARGLALALAVPAVGVSTLEALALGAPGPVVACVDARGGKVYTQPFGIGTSTAPALSTIEDAPLPPSRAEADVIGFSAEALSRRTGGRDLAPRHPVAVAIAQLAGRRMHNTDLPRPAPLYIKQADAAPSKETGPVML